MAKRDGELMTDAQLLRQTRWSKEKLRRIAESRTWDGISVKDVDVFLVACGLTWSTQRRQLWLLKIATEKGLEGIRRMHHLRKPVAQKAGRVLRLLKRTEEILKNQ
jgi:hypothetical protein